MKLIKKISTLLFLCTTGLFLLSGCGSSAVSSENTSSASTAAATDLITLQDGSTLNPAGTHHIEIAVENYGTISVELDGDAAPISVANFLKLTASGFYDGLTFHRVIDGFMIQGGDPEGTGYGGSDDKITGEFSSNGIDNPLSHTRGAISMARSKENDSASSQFFIVQTDYPSLDGDYACFGYVTDGMDIVDAICKDTPVQDGNGTVAAADQPVITTITIVD